MATRLNPYLTFAELHAREDPAEKDKGMHSQLTADNSLMLMGADTPNTMDFTVGATIGEPLSTAPWGDSFGMATDKLGVSRLININGSPS